MLKEFQSIFIFAVCLLAFTVVVFFVKYENERAQSQMLEQKSIESANMVVVIEKEAQEAHRKSILANKRADESAKNAKAAREMLEQARIKNAMSQKEIVDSLNAQLEREADARIAAENASKELVVERDRLSKAVAETRNALNILRKTKKSSSSSVEIEKMRRILSDREAEIERLKVRQAELERMHKEARDAQLRIESEMSSKNYRITLPRHKRVIFPITKFRSM
ncbi:MAG: hypothetical protein J6B07_00345 [Opitutales bacterium]|nr:hypothetical protein [Opitutales bacterium]